MNQNDEYDIVDAIGPYHDFWLIRPTELEYSQYQHLVGRKDAPVRLSDDVFGYLEQTLIWVPNDYSGRHETSTGYGLNRYGPTVIPSASGECFRQICLLSSATQ